MLRKLLDLPMPEPFGRFWLPVVQTSLKESVLTGLYDTEVSEAEDGVEQVRNNLLESGSRRSSTPSAECFAGTPSICQQERVPQVPKMGLLKTLREQGRHSRGNKAEACRRESRCGITPE